jgi:hypothetical protein
MDADLADAVRKKLLEARFAAGAQLLAQANPHEVDLGNAVSAGWPLRALTWFRSRCGSFFQPTGDGVGMHMTMGDGGPSKMSSSVSGEAACGSEKDSCTFTFNARETKSIEGFFRVLEEDTIELKDFAPAEQAFAAGCKAFAAGKGAEVEGHFRRALDIEPNWNRISALLAVMRALRSGEERRADAREAAEAAKTWTDDFELRRLVIYLRAWAGDAELEAEIKDLAQREAQYSVRNLSAL